MGKRLGLGLLIGLLVGGVLGYALLQLMGDPMGGLLGYAFAATVGVLVGLLAGKPIWAKGAAVEAGLKAGIGALAACLLLLGLRYIPISIPALAMIPGARLGYHALGSLMAVATVLAIFYELDNTDGDAEKVDKNAPTRKRVDAPTGKRLPAATADDLDGEEPVASKKKGKM